MSLNLELLKRRLDEFKKDDSVRNCEICGFDFPCVCEQMHELMLDDLRQEALQAISFHE